MLKLPVIHNQALVLFIRDFVYESYQFYQNVIINGHAQVYELWCIM